MISINNFQRLNHQAELDGYARQNAAVRKQREEAIENGEEVKLYTHEERLAELEEIEVLEEKLGFDVGKYPKGDPRNEEQKPFFTFSSNAAKASGGTQVFERNAGVIAPR